MLWQDVLKVRDELSQGCLVPEIQCSYRRTLDVLEYDEVTAVADLEKDVFLCPVDVREFPDVNGVTNLIEASAHRDLLDFQVSSPLFSQLDT